MEEGQPIFQTSDLDDDIIYSSDSDDEPPQLQPEPLNHIIPDPYPSSSDPDDVTLPTTTTTISSSVTVAIPSSFNPPPSAAVTTPAAAAPRPIDDSRKLFQRLWTDKDEIELLKGFLDYTATRGPTASGHYHDTGPFYDQIKNKLQLDFNKNQLVEKLRRLKKKYRVNLAKINSGKDFVFKSPHDHATFEISKKIWCNVSENTNRGGIPGVEFDFDNHNPNPNPIPNRVSIAAGTPPRPLNSCYVISHINLNSASPGGGGGGGGGGYDMMLPNWSGNGGGGLPKLCTRKRSRVAYNTGKAEGKFVKNECGIGIGIGISNTDNFSTNNDSSVVPNNAGVSPPLQGMVEETVRNCLSPVLKDLINNAINGASGITGLSGVGIGGAAGGSHGFNLNPVLLNVLGVNVEGGMDEKWRKQQILELEVYSKRLDLVQEQIKLSLEELSNGSNRACAMYCNCSWLADVMNAECWLCLLTWIELRFCDDGTRGGRRCWLDSTRPDPTRLSKFHVDRLCIKLRFWIPGGTCGFHQYYYSELWVKGLVGKYDFYFKNSETQNMDVYKGLVFGCVTEMKTIWMG